MGQQRGHTCLGGDKVFGWRKKAEGFFYKCPIKHVFHIRTDFWQPKPIRYQQASRHQRTFVGACDVGSNCGPSLVFCNSFWGTCSYFQKHSFIGAPGQIRWKGMKQWSILENPWLTRLDLWKIFSAYVLTKMRISSITTSHRSTWARMAINEISILCYVSDLIKLEKLWLVTSLGTKKNCYINLLVDPIIIESIGVIAQSNLAFISFICKIMSTYKFHYFSRTPQ